MSTAPQDSLQTRPQTRVKVWRPQGVAGVEVELFENIPQLQTPILFLDGFYEMTVATPSDFKLYYMGAMQRFSARENIFLVQHPGESVGGQGIGADPLTARTLRLYPELMTDVKKALRLKTDTPYFPSMTTDENLNAPIAKLASESIQAFDEGATSLECESRLLALMYAALTHLSDTPPPDLKLGNEHRAVALVKEVVHTHLDSEVKLDHLALLTDLSKYHLIRVFQRDVGMTPHTYQTSLRINKTTQRG